MTLRSLAPLAALLPLLAACGDDPLVVDDPRDCFDEDEPIPAVVLGDTSSEELTSDDCRLQDESRVDVYRLTVDSTRTVTVRMWDDTLAAAPDPDDPLDSYLLLWRLSDDPDVEPDLVAENDDETISTLDAEIVTTLMTGEYLIGANGFDPDDLGPYLLSVTR